MVDVDKKFDLFSYYKTNCFFEIMFLATLPSFEKKSIGKRLCEFSILLANEIRMGQSLELLPSHLKSMRPSVVTSNFSSRFSQKIGEFLNFETHYEEQYTDLFYKGKSYAERINNPLHNSTTLAAKSLV